MDAVKIREERKRRPNQRQNRSVHAESSINRRVFSRGQHGRRERTRCSPDFGLKRRSRFAASKEAGSKEQIELPDFRFSLAKQPARELTGGSAREATAREFP